MLIGNYSVYSKAPGRLWAGTTTSPFTMAHDRANFGTSGAMRGRYFQSSFDKTSSLPDTYRPPNTWMIPQKSGALGSRNTIKGTGSLEAGGALGRNLAADLTGSGDITNAAMGLILSAVATLSGTGGLSANMVGVLNGAIDLTGQGDITAALEAIAHVVADLTGSGEVSPVISAIASGSIDINVTGGTLTTANVAELVWGALAAAFNDTGTMGEKLNDAGASGNPWAALLNDNNDPGTFGERVQRLLTLAKYMGLK